MRISDPRGKRNGTERTVVSTMHATIVLLCLVTSWFGELQAQVREPKEAPPAETPKNTKVDTPILAEDYVIGPDDMLNIYVLDVPELSRDYRVSAAGTITIPVLANPVDAAGSTLSQLSKLLSQELKAQGLVSDPHITLTVQQSRVHSVAIVGAVKRPQVYPLLSRSTLLDMLSQAEGLADDAGNNVIVYRGNISMRASQRTGGATHTPEQVESGTVTIDLKRLFESGDPTLNVSIYPGDRITVPRAGVVYVVGAVNKPGGFTMKASTHGMTVLQALALAEDTKTTAKQNQTVIIRNDPQAPEGRKQIPVDLKSILQGKSPDPVLQAEDILFIPDSSGKRAFNRGIESVVQAATGVAIYGARF
jgi:polysaccharide export outer membrane protein